MSEMVLAGHYESVPIVNSGSRRSGYPWLFNPEGLRFALSLDSRVSVPFVEAEPGFVSVTVGRPTQWAPEEYVMLSVWRSEADIAAFAGENWNSAVIPQGMEKYVSECWVHHYENFN